MFTILNRWRGTKGYWSKIIGGLIAIALYFLIGDWVTALLVGIGYIAGESFGWGKWIGGIMHQKKEATPEQLANDEGIDNGIHWLANKIAPQAGNYIKYCITALTIRGAYWWILTLLPLVVFGYIGILPFVGSVIALGLAFPLSVIIGNYTETKFDFSSKIFGFSGSWEQAEVWYGLAQDIVLGLLLFLIIL